MMSLEELFEVSSRIVSSVLKAADTRGAVKRWLGFKDGALRVGERVIPLHGGLAFAAAGKAAPPMAEAAVEALGGKIDRGIVVMPHGLSCALSEASPGIEVLPAAHPVPDLDGVQAASRVLKLASTLKEDDVLLVLLSGGSSSLLSLPLPPVSLEDLRKTTDLLIKSGADIRRINVVRKHLSAIAGGRLAEAARCRVVTLAVSDVVGDLLPFIASGPTVADPSTFAEALFILGELGLSDRVPPTVLRLLRDGAEGKAQETPKSLPDRHAAFVIASNALATEAASREAASRGFAPVRLPPLEGEARDAGRMLAKAALGIRRNGRPVPPPACIVTGGETTVTVTGAGRGGRNQEIALSAAVELAGENGILLGSFATDGVEGNTTAAGAHAWAHTIAEGRAAGLDPERCLMDNDSYAFLSAAGGLIVTGPTYTNVNDVSFVLVAK
jgi:glycerate 2-kinase